MSVFIRLAIGLHALLTRWYPSDFRDEFGAEVLAVLTIVDRQEGAEAYFTQNNLKLVSIFKAEDF